MKNNHLWYPIHHDALKWRWNSYSVWKMVLFNLCVDVLYCISYLLLFYVHGEYVCVFSIIIKSIVSSIIIFIDIHMRSISCLRAHSIVLFNNGKSRWMQSHMHCYKYIIQYFNSQIKSYRIIIEHIILSIYN